MLVSACGGDDDDAGSGNSADSSLRVADITDQQYQALCQRVAAISDLSVLDECTSNETTAECNDCTDGLLGETGECSDTIGEAGSYPSSCTWTLGMLNACIDEQKKLLDSLSCDKPGREMLGDDDNCMYLFRKKCVPESI
jgi:hypothetical protein